MKTSARLARMVTDAVFLGFTTDAVREARCPEMYYFFPLPIFSPTFIFVLLLPLLLWNVEMFQKDDAPERVWIVL